MKISERALELRRAEYAEEYRDSVTAGDMSGYWVALALDEWQASVEERLASIGLGLVPGKCTEEVLASGSAPSFNPAGCTVLFAGVALEQGSEPFAISDPGPSRYDPEVEGDEAG